MATGTKANVTIKIQKDSILIEDQHNFTASLKNICEYKDSNKFCDVVLCVPLENDERENKSEELFQELYGHSCRLASGSTFMYDILSNDVISKKQQKRLVFQDIEYHILTLCVDFMYGMGIKVKYQDLNALKDAAVLLKINALQKHCIFSLGVIAKEQDEPLNIKTDQVVIESKFQQGDMCRKNIPVINEINYNFANKKNVSTGSCSQFKSVEIPVKEVIKCADQIKTEDITETCELIETQELMNEYLDPPEIDDNQESLVCKSSGNFNKITQAVSQSRKDTKMTESPCFESSADIITTGTIIEELKSVNTSSVILTDHRVDVNKSKFADSKSFPSLPSGKNVKYEKGGNKHERKLTKKEAMDNKPKRVKKYANLREKNQALTEMGRKPRPCKHCGVMYKNYRALRKHMKEITGDVLTCQYCSKTFYTKSSLTCHEKRHREEKSFKCSMCEFQAVTKVEVEWHMASHGTMPGAMCELCGKSYRRKRTLKIHMVQVHGESAQLHEGPHCSYSHPSLAVVKYHMIRHQKYGTEVCKICGKTYKRKHSLREHMKVAHNNDEPISMEFVTSNQTDNENENAIIEHVEEDEVVLSQDDTSNHIYSTAEYQATEGVYVDDDSKYIDEDQQLIIAARNSEGMGIVVETVGESQTNIIEYVQYASNLDVSHQNVT